MSAIESLRTRGKALPSLPSRFSRERCPSGLFRIPNYRGTSNVQVSPSAFRIVGNDSFVPYSYFYRPPNKGSDTSSVFGKYLREFYSSRKINTFVRFKKSDEALCRLQRWERIASATAKLPTRSLILFELVSFTRELTRLLSPQEFTRVFSSPDPRSTGSSVDRSFSP